MTQRNCTRYDPFTHAGIAAGVGIAFGESVSVVCLRSNRKMALAIKTPELGTRISLLYTSRSVKRSRSHGYENRHGRMVASDHGRYCVTLLPAAVVGVVDTTACF